MRRGRYRPTRGAGFHARETAAEVGAPDEVFLRLETIGKIEMFSQNLNIIHGNMGEMLVFPLFFVFLDGFWKPSFFYAVRRLSVLSVLSVYR